MNTLERLLLVDTAASAMETVSTDHLLDRDLREMPVTGPLDVSEQRARAVAAKLSLPHMGFVHSRARLRARLEPVRGGGVVYLVAGPGYGKTTFIVDLLSSAPGRPVYFSLDEGDRDPGRFLSYLMAGLGMEPPEVVGASSLEWPAPGVIEGLVLDLTAKVVDFMSSMPGERVFVAIDDFHLVDSSSQVVGALELIIRGLPPGWTMIVSSRRPPPLRLDGVSLGGRLVELQARHLRLTPGEVAGWAQHNWEVKLHAEETRALWRVTQGWPAALVLLGGRLRPGESGTVCTDISEAISRGRDLRAYVEEGVLSGLDQETTRTLLTAGLLPRVTFPRDDGFFRESTRRTEAALEDCVSRGFLVSRSGCRSYTIHPLIRGLARRQAARTDPAAELLDRAAMHLESLGDSEEAVSLYLRAGRFAQAAHLVRSLILASLNTTARCTREEWSGLIPEGVSGDDEVQAWLLVAKARILQDRSDYSRAGALYERAAQIIGAQGDKEGLLPVLLSLAFCLYARGLWEEALAVVTRCRSLARTPLEKVEILIPEGGVLVGLGRWDEAVEKWEKALALAPAELRPALSWRVHGHRARLFYCLGHYRLAKLWAERIPAGGNGRGTLSHAMALSGLSVFSCLTGDYDRAVKLTQECLRLPRARGHALVEIPCLLGQALQAEGRWDYRGAVAKIVEARALAAQAGDPEETFRVEMMLGDLCRRTGNAQRALEHHRAALAVVEENHLAVFQRMLAVGSTGADLVVLGKGVEAQSALEEAVRHSRKWGLKGSLAPALFYLGWLHALAGREHEAARCLSESMRIADEHGHVHYFGQEAKIAIPILALCDRFGAGSFVREKIVPLTPDRLRAHFLALAEGKTYPTDVPLGPPRRRDLSRPAAVDRAGMDQLAPTVVAGIESLTERERDILKMVALGMPNKVIGAKLFITEKTVKTHTNHIFRKLGVASRLQATLVFQSYQRTLAAEAMKRRTHK
ncbi:MAG: hypothetical protein JXA87_07650 [Thermoleophilia bacterium]|nr:hypothetical protein [Thermoleophilia bacterium]